MSPKKKMPTKTELLQLQKLYKTDEKIGERLGGVPAYLVAYWRRKKNIPKYSLPKFSETEIRNLWERFGDDEKCGLELGISKAAFYNWRRRYGIREKPAFLKLEQLEFNFPGSRYSVHANSLYGKQSLAQKIMAAAAEKEKVDVGEVVQVEPHIALLHEGAEEVIGKFRQAGPEYVWNPNRVVVSLDYRENEYSDLALVHRAVREFVKRQGIKNAYDQREGLPHQVGIEKGHILPGQLVLGTDALTPSYGCLGALAAAITPEQMATIWTEGKLEMAVPNTIRVNITGRRTRGVYSKDIALSTVMQLGTETVRGKVIEFGGSVVSQMSLSERFTMSNMAVNTGALAAICLYDATTRRYLTGRTMNNYKPMVPDRDAEYDELYQISIDQLTPQVGCPGNGKAIKPAVEIEGLSIRQVVIGTASNGRFDDLRIAADVLKGKHVHPDCIVYVYPGSRSVYLEALKKGLIRVFIEAGAMVMNPGSEPFSSVRDGGFADGDRCLATTACDDVEGRCSGKSELYICSPATAAASALNGAVTDPTRYVR